MGLGSQTGADFLILPEKIVETGGSVNNSTVILVCAGHSNNLFPLIINTERFLYVDLQTLLAAQ
jgi:hypothetical protein